MAPTYKIGDVVYCGVTPGWTKRVATVTRVDVEGTTELVTVENARRWMSCWFARDLRPAAIEHWPLGSAA